MFLLVKHMSKKSSNIDVSQELSDPGLTRHSSEAHANRTNRREVPVSEGVFGSWCEEGGGSERVGCLACA
jgi:hypothetical protein